MADEIRLASPFDREGQILGFYATVGLWALMLYAVWRNVGVDPVARRQRRGAKGHRGHKLRLKGRGSMMICALLALRGDFA